ncbi:unnamed protein product, partial [Mesorhabditis spiculigera]
MAPVEEKQTEEPVVVRMRNRGGSAAPAPQATPLQPTIHEEEKEEKEEKEEMANSTVHQALFRGMGVLQEGETSEETEEIRKLNSQMDHLNDYMGKVEERLKEHNKKMMETLEHQKAEREKRRRSFHERLQTNQQEDDDFQKQMAAILGRVNNMRNRASVYDIVSQMEVPKVNLNAQT